MLADQELVRQMALRNNRQGNLDPDIYDCKVCKNRGYWWEVAAKKKEDGFQDYEILVECSCITLRRQRIAAKYGIDINMVKIKYGTGQGCGYKGFDYNNL